MADSGRVAVNPGEQVGAVGAICAEHANCLLEIANEPWHETQQRGLGEAQALATLRALVPPGVPVSLGSPPIDDSAAYAGGDYSTVHLDRGGGREGWGHVLRMGGAAALSARTGKPVVDDEPIGAAESAAAGPEDASPARWFAKGVLSRVLGLGATFHFEGGLHGLIPRAGEAACFAAWRRGLAALPPGAEEETAVMEAGTPGAAVVSFDRARGAGSVLAQGEHVAWAVAVAVTGDPRVRWRADWRTGGVAA